MRNGCLSHTIHIEANGLHAGVGLVREAPSERYAYFPASLPGELPYSMLARYKQILGLPYEASLWWDFGLPSIVSATFPIKLARFVALTQPEHTDIKEFLTSHTVFPYVSAFMTSNERTSLRRGCLYGFDQLSAGQAGMSKRFLAFCPQCVEEDVVNQGQAAWRRVHQLPGVFRCPYHSAVLRRADARSRTRALHVCPTEPTDGTELQSSMQHDFALMVARLSNELLGGLPPLAERHALSGAMVRLIRASGWANNRGQVSGAFSEHVLHCVKGDFATWGTVNENLFLIRLARVWMAIGRARPCPPSLIVLTLAALERTVDDLAVEIAAERADRDIPKQPARPDARKYYASHAKTVEHRTKISDFLLDHPAATRTDVAHGVSSSFIYQKRNDSEWLNSLLPKITPQKRQQNIDATLASQVPAAAARLLGKTGRPSRVTPYALGHELRPNGISSGFLKSAPLTMRAFRNYTETIEAVARRRLEWVARELVRNRECVRRSVFENRASFPRSMTLIARQIFELVQHSLSTTDPLHALEKGLREISAGD